MSDDNDPAANKVRRGLLPPEFAGMVGPSLSVGAATGSVGLVTGVVGGLMRDLSPGLLGLATGGQWFALGTTYWFTRTIVVRTWGAEQMTPTDRIKASALAGGTTGMFAGLLRGPKNIIPGTIMFTIFGGGGQTLVNYFQGLDWSRKERKSIFESKWSPLRKISDEEYKDMMDEKILRLDAEISLIEDKIAELRREDQKSLELASQSVQDETSKGQGQ